MTEIQKKPPPAFGDVLPSAHPSDDTINLLRRRRSTPADFLGEPGPGPAALDVILEIGARVPDHRIVTPYRFIIFEGEARERAGKIIEAAFRRNEPGASDERAAKEAGRFLRAPVVVAVISSVDKDHRTPKWEQLMTAGAVCQNLLIAASAHGYAAQWLTEWYAYDENVLAGFGLNDGERIAGFIYIGAATEPPKERKRPTITDIVGRF